MSQLRRAIIAVAFAVVGWSLMGLAHDMPQWYFQATGISGAALFLGALGWWLVSGLAAHDRRRNAAGASVADHTAEGRH